MSLSAEDREEVEKAICDLIYGTNLAKTSSSSSSSQSPDEILIEHIKNKFTSLNDGGGVEQCTHFSAIQNMANLHNEIPKENLDIIKSDRTILEQAIGRNKLNLLPKLLEIPNVDFGLNENVLQLIKGAEEAGNQDANESLKIISIKPSLVSDFEDDFELIEENPERDLHKFNYKADFEERGPSSLWSIHKGFDSGKHLMLMPLLAKPESNFALKNLYSIPTNSILNNDSTHTLCFKTNDDQRNVVYFAPDQGMLVFYNPYERATKLDPDNIGYSLKEALSNISDSLNKIDIKTRFIIPFTESPQLNVGSSNPQHAVLLCIDYDPDTKKLEPVVFDSITRNIVDYGTKLFKRQVSNTCDAVLKLALEEEFVSNKETKCELVPLVRHDYGHQNRMTEGNCGSYTFKLAKMAADSFAKYDNFPDFNKHIPQPNGFVHADNLLTIDEINEIESAVNTARGWNLASLHKLDKISSYEVGEASIVIKEYIDQTLIDAMHLNYFREVIANKIEDDIKVTFSNDDVVLNKMKLIKNSLDLDEMIRHIKDIPPSKTEGNIFEQAANLIEILKNMELSRANALAALVNEYDASKVIPDDPRILIDEDKKRFLKNFDEFMSRYKALIGDYNLLSKYAAWFENDVQWEKSSSYSTYILKKAELEHKYPVHHALARGDMSKAVIDDVLSMNISQALTKDEMGNTVLHYLMSNPSADSPPISEAIKDVLTKSIGLGYKEKTNLAIENNESKTPLDLLLQNPNRDKIEKKINEFNITAGTRATAWLRSVYKIEDFFPEMKLKKEVEEKIKSRPK